MRVASLLAFATMIVLGGCRGPGSSAVPEARADVPAPGAGSPLAVVELFTSEGCSSCPPADDGLAALAARPDVAALAFHVDYWDELGWTDRFAGPDRTARQRAYARSLAEHGVFTPEMIVGGTEAFVGSDRARAESAIAAVLARPARVALALRATGRTGGGAIDVAYAATGQSAGDTLVAALVERTARTEVRAGENAGRTLRHADVVRSFVTVPLLATGSATLRAPDGLRAQDAEIIAFAQRTAPGPGMPVLGAARTPCPPLR